MRSEGGEFVAQKVGLARDFHQYVGAFRQEEGALDGKGFYGVVVVVFGQDVQQDGVYIRAGLVGDLVMALGMRLGWDGADFTNKVAHLGNFSYFCRKERTI